MIHYSRHCCLVRISDTPPEDPSFEPLGTQEGDMEAMRVRFADAHAGGDWYRETPALSAHIKAVCMGHHTTGEFFPTQRFIPTAIAIVWTGRERQVLYRWAREGRITRYGDASQALWDVFELPVKGSSGPPPKGPQKAV